MCNRFPRRFSPRCGCAAGDAAKALGGRLGAHGAFAAAITQSDATRYDQRLRRRSLRLRCAPSSWTLQAAPKHQSERPQQPRDRHAPPAAPKRAAAAASAQITRAQITRAQITRAQVTSGPPQRRALQSGPRSSRAGPQGRCSSARAPPRSTPRRETAARCANR